MVKRDDLVDYIHTVIGKELLAKAEKKDDMANGVQFHGGEDVEVVTLGVSLNEEFLAKAVEEGSNFSIFHHGFDPGVYKARYSKSSQKRLRIIIQNNMTIMGLHYVLDAHPQIGNNAKIIELLEAKITGSLYEEWGFSAEFSKPQPVEILKKKCEALIGRDIYHISGDNESVVRIGVVSGAGKPADPYLAELEQKDIQLYISGETSEWHPHRMKENGIHYFVCGHYTTETFGVRALGEKIKKHFKDAVRVQFIDVPNPV